VRFEPMTLPEEWDWVEERVGHRNSEAKGIIAYDNFGKMCAGFYADGFSPDSCRVHLAIDNPAVIRRGFLNECLGYVFGTCKMNRIFGVVASNNTKALKFNHHIGFRAIAKLPEWYYKGVTHIVMRMDADNNRWYQQETT